MPYIPPTLPRKAKPHPPVATAPFSSTSASQLPSSSSSYKPPPPPNPRPRASSSSMSPSQPPISSFTLAIPPPQPTTTLTPSPTSPRDPTTHLASNLASMHLTTTSPAPIRPDSPPQDSSSSFDRPRSESTVSTAPSLTHDAPSNSTSTSSLRSLSDGDPLAASEMTASGGGDTPETSVGIGESGGGLELRDAERRYKEGLYLYTRSLWLQAKVTSARAQKAKEDPAAAFANFGPKQSGMERLAKKKALAKQLNA